MRVLLGPYDFAGQSTLVTRALRDRGVDAQHLLYAWKGRVDYGYQHDRLVELDRSNWLTKQLGAVTEVIEQRPDIVHLWNRSLVAPPGGFSFFNGFDLPLLKAAGIRIVYRFTGYDLRQQSVDKAINPYSPAHRGYVAGFDETVQRCYHDHLRQWVDAFVVQDPEMRTFMPEADMIPRGIDLSELPFVGLQSNPRPLVVHAPSSRVTKGTDDILAAVETLQSRGVEFDFELVEKLAHRDAVELYRRADIIIDQMLVGWYGVLAVEAMALGKPVIAYLRPGLAEQIDSPVPVYPATVDSLADRLETLIADRELRERLSLESRKFAEEVHDLVKVADQWEALYQRVIDSPRAVITDSSPRYWASQAPSQLDVHVRARRYDRIRKEYFQLRRVGAEVQKLEPKVAELQRGRVTAADIEGAEGAAGPPAGIFDRLRMRLLSRHSMLLRARRLLRIARRLLRIARRLPYHSMRLRAGRVLRIARRNPARAGRIVRRRVVRTAFRTMTSRRGPK